MHCFVTGSTGFLGATLVQKLVSNGNSVTALVRDAGKADKVVDKAAQVVVGDICEVGGFSSSLENVDVVYHTAAYFKEYNGLNQKDEATLQAVNVDAVIELLNASKKAGVQVFVHVSSSGVMAPIKGGNESTEMFTKTVNRYYQSKIRCEKEIGKWISENPGSVRVVLVRPVAIVGPGDRGPTGLGKSMIELVQGKIPVIPPGALNFVDVRDVADAMINAGEKGGNGEKYLVSAEFKTMTELAESVSKASGVKPPSRKAPLRLAMALAGVQEFLANLFGTEPQFTRIILRTVLENEEFDGSKVKKELNIEYRTFDESIREGVAWFKENEYV